VSQNGQRSEIHPALFFLGKLHDRALVRTQIDPAAHGLARTISGGG